MSESKVPSWFAIAFTTGGAALRVILAKLAIPNFAPIGAVGLYGGSKLRAWQATALPLLCMVVSDLTLEWSRGDARYGLGDPSRPWVYASYLVYLLLGRFAMGKAPSWLRIGAVSLAGSTQFFLITNFQAWLAYTDLYARDLSGLLASYVAAIPFASGTFVGDLTFAYGLFGLHVWCERTEAQASLPGEKASA